MAARPAVPYLVFEVTTDCNLTCGYCYNVYKRPGCGTERLNSYSQAKKALKRLFKQADVGNIAMTGGEPFLAERFAELVLWCRMKGKEVTVITNGTAATRDDLAALIDLGVTAFEIPQHAPTSSTHDELTGVRGSWAKARRTFLDVIKLGGTPVGVIVITALNARYVAETLQHLADLGVRQIMINRFNVGGRGIRQRGRLELGHEALREAFRQAEQVAAKRKLRVSSNVCTPLCVIDTGLYPHVAFSSCSPDVRRRPLTMDIQGGIRFCNHSPVVAGTIFETTFSAILESEYFGHWGDVVPDLCRGCRKWLRCYGGCRAASEQLGLSLAHADPIIDS